VANSAYADASQRLPWLTDSKPKPEAKAPTAIAPILVSLILVLAIGLAGWSILGAPEQPRPAPTPSETIALPPPAEVQAPATATRPVSERSALDPGPSSAGQPPAAMPSKPAGSRKAALRQSRPKAVMPASSSEASPYDARAWRSGIPGRIIQIGAYRSSAQAQAEWQRAYMRYPLLRPLSPRVMKSRTRGRTYYRLQLGTSSQAHSELLCQRLRTLGESCLVLGLPNRG